MCVSLEGTGEQRGLGRVFLVLVLRLWEVRSQPSPGTTSPIVPPQNWLPSVLPRPSRKEAILAPRLQLVSFVREAVALVGGQEA